MLSATIKLSVAIITLNEERNIERCIRSVQPVADEIVVVDSYSTDRTKEICEQLGARFLENPFVDFVQQKNFALDSITHEYILSLDADEALSEELQQAIVRVKNDCRFSAYRFNRLTNYCGQWIHHGGWYPDAKLRLWKRSAGRWSGSAIHESVQLDDPASVQWIKHNILHYSYYSIADHVTQINKFSSISAQAYHQKGKKVIPIVHLTIYPFVTFVSRYVFRLGFLDGYMGYVVCKSVAYVKYLKYLKLYQLKKRR
jgi:glycosyltransferase involved in cell wall biosynthesis